VYPILPKSIGFSGSSSSVSSLSRLSSIECALASPRLPHDWRRDC
jgi:hypothetical protein